MVIPSRLVAQGASQAQPAAPPSLRRTRRSNATAHPGLPDKPAPRHTSEQKQADEEQVRQANNAKKLALQNTYNRISTVQANMAIKQAEAKNLEHMAMHPRPSALQKEPHDELPVIQGPCYPCKLFVSSLCEPNIPT